MSAKTNMKYWCENCQREITIRKRKDGTYVNCPVCREFYKKSSKKEGESSKT